MLYAHLIALIDRLISSILLLILHSGNQALHFLKIGCNLNFQFCCSGTSLVQAAVYRVPQILVGVKAAIHSPTGADPGDGAAASLFPAP